jgi:hypothetical protein
MDYMNIVLQIVHCRMYEYICNTQGLGTESIFAIRCNGGRFGPVMESYSRSLAHWTIPNILL